MRVLSVSLFIHVPLYAYTYIILRLYIYMIPGMSEFSYTCSYVHVQVMLYVDVHVLPSGQVLAA